MKTLFTLIMLVSFMLVPTLYANAESTTEKPQAPTVSLTIGNASFSVALEQNETAEAFRALLPTTLLMSELNGNEKYIYLDDPLPSQAESIGSIKAGDLMLYGDSCVVLFYESFQTSYRYTRIGHIENADGLAEAVGRGEITAAFEDQAEAPVIETSVMVTINDLTFPATLRSNAAANDLLSRLPYSVVLNKGPVDFCGNAGTPFAYEQSDYQHGFEYGDLLFTPDGNWFVIFTDGIETYGQQDWIVLGHMECDMEALRALNGSVSVTISKPE